MSILSLMQVRSIKFAALLFASTAALTLLNTLPAQYFPQWATIKGEEEGNDLIYDFNSLKALPKGIKQIDTYFPRIKEAAALYVSYPRWRWTAAGGTKWVIIPPDTLLETLAYKLCGKS